MNYELMAGRAVYPSLTDKHVLITGGASGIGRSLVEHFADQGAIVTFVDLNDDAAVAVIKGCVDRGGRAPFYHNLDLRNVAALEELIRQAGAERGPISSGEQCGP